MPSFADFKPPPPSRNVLLVEDEPVTQRFCLTGLRGLAEFRLLSASNGAEALAILQSQTVDVVVTDLNMPVLDGFALIAILGQKYPFLPVIVLTSVAERGLLDRAVELGALRVLAKPPKLSLLMAEIRAAAAVKPTGIVQGLALTSVLQLLNWERRTATLTVRGEYGKGAQGYLYVKDGEVIQAACGSLEGLPAAYAILAWTGVHLEFVDACRMQPVITLPLAELLLNAAVDQDTRAARPERPADADAGTGSTPEPGTSRQEPDDHWFG
jgi:CheY-like chemotaxis protein